MPAGKQGAKDILIEYDDGPGGVLQDITQYVRGDVAVKVMSLLQESHAFGDEYDEHTPTGHNRMDPITLSGLYDDTAAVGPAVIFKKQAGDSDPQGATRTLKVTWGNAKSTEVETRLESFQRTAKVGALTEYEAVVQPTGAPTEV